MRWLHKTWHISLILAVLLSACSVNSTANSSLAAPCPDFKVGVVIASGDTLGAQEQKEGYEMALAEINQAGGVLKRCKVALDYPAQGETNRAESAQSAMLELADHGVAAILGATSNDATKQAAAISNYLKIPFVVATETGDDIVDIGTQWVIRLPPQNKAYAEAAFEMVKSTLGDQANIGILYEHTEYGESAAVEAGKAVLNRELNLAIYQGYTTETSDFSAILDKFKAAQVSMVYLVSTKPSQARTILKTLHDKSLGVTMVMGNGSGFSNRGFFYDQGVFANDLETLLIPVAWSPDLPWGKDFDARLKNYRASAKISSVLPAEISTVEAYTALHLVVGAIDELAGNAKENWLAKLSNKENLPAFRDALTQTLRRTKTGVQDSLFGPIEFNVDGQNQAGTYIVQVVGGKLVTVFPDSYAVQAPVLNKGW